MVISSVIEERWFYATTWILAVFAIIGNTVVIVVHQTSRSLRSVTSVFIKGLAGADMLAGAALIPGMIGEPEVQANFWGEFYCKVVGSYFFLWTSAKASILIMVFATSERYCSIAHPILHKRYFTKLTAKLFLLLAWAIAIAINLFSLIILHAGDGTCVVVWKEKNSQVRNIIGVVIFVVSFLLPLTLMFVAYIRMFASLRNREKRLNRPGDSGGGGAVSNNKRKSKSQIISHRIRKNIITMLFIVVCTFTVCWAPDQLCYLLMNLGVHSFDYEKSPVYPYFVILAISNSCANPIIYSFKNKPFKDALRKRFLRRKNRVRADNDDGESLNDTFRNGADSIAAIETTMPRNAASVKVGTNSSEVEATAK